MFSHDAIVLGNGLVAKTLALAFERLGLRSIRIAPRQADYPNDPRSYAIAPSSLRLLRALGLKFSAEECTPVERVELGFGTILQAPLVSLSQSGDMFVMIDHSVLNSKLDALLKGETKEIEASEFAFTEFSTSLPQFEGITAPLLIVAEGKQSQNLARLGFSFERFDYHQRAITAKFQTEIPHNQTARQLFEPTGPLGLLPGESNTISIVWSQKENTAKALLALDEAEFCQRLESKIGGYYGTLKITHPRASFPLQAATAHRLTAHRIALIGDSAHALHPIAGQGLNLGLRDIACLVESVRQAKIIGLDMGNKTTLDQYSNWRKADIVRLNFLTRTMNELTQNENPIHKSAQFLTEKIAAAAQNRLAKMSDLPLSPEPPLLQGRLY